MDNNQSGYRYPSIEMRQSPDNKTWWLIGLLILFTAGVFLFKGNQGNIQTQPTPTPQASAIQQSASPSATVSSSNPSALGKRTKTSNCISVNGLPDKECTPGDIDPKVTQDNIQSTICVSGYTKTVRPPVSYTDNLKIELMQEYGDTDSVKNYELDHLIPLELGGNPTSEANLWPESYTTTPNARNKDKVENYLHEQVCSGVMKLQEAQLNIANNWEQFYKASF